MSNNSNNTPLVSMVGIGKRFGSVQALKGVDFEVYPGEVVGLVGDNGAGKSTTLKSISKLIKPRSGKIILEGEDITNYPPHELVYKGITMVPEGRGVFARLSVEENLEMEGPVTDGKKCVMGRVKVVRREKITIASGNYDTYLVEPDLKHIGGVFEKSKNARLQIWVTADERQIPVKVKSRVVVGSFVGELISIEQTPIVAPEDVQLLRADRH